MIGGYIKPKNGGIIKGVTSGHQYNIVRKRKWLSQVQQIQV